MTIGKRPAVHRLILALLLAATAPRGHAQNQTFGIQLFSVKGSRLLTSEEIRAATAAHTGRDKVYADVQRAVEALEAIYRHKGYSAVDVYVPEQDITQGSVEIQIVESVIGKVTISGNRNFDDANILASLPELVAGKAPNVRRLSENVQLANSNPGKQVDAVLAVSDQPGVIDARVSVVDQNPLRFVVNADNTGSGALGRHRAGFAIQHANLWGHDHVGTLSYGTSVEEPSDMRSISASYRVPFYAWGDSLDFIYGDSKVSTATPNPLTPLQFTGAGQIAAARYNFNFGRRGEYSSRLILGADDKRFQNTCTFAGTGTSFSAAGCSDTTVRPVSLAYGGQRLKPGSLFDYTLGYHQNVSGSNSDPSTPVSGTARPEDRFRIVRANASWFGNVIGQWQGRLAASGQYSSDPLIAGEQFGIAGSNGVRGFTERAVATDVGLVVNVEAYTPNINSLLGLDKQVGDANLRALAFFDVGYGKNQGTIVAPVIDKQVIASVGLGARYDYQRDLSLRWDNAAVVENGPPGTAQNGDWRTHFSLLLSF
jgi:hemolysin activation/secretion protein